MLHFASIVTFCGVTSVSSEGRIVQGPPKEILMHETVFNYFLRADSGPDNDNVPNYLQIGDKTRLCFIRLKHTDRNVTFTPWSLLRPITNLF